MDEKSRTEKKLKLEVPDRFKAHHETKIESYKKGEVRNERGIKDMGKKRIISNAETDDWGR